MSDQKSSKDGDGKAIVKERHLSWVWLIPLASLMIGGWLLWSTLTRRGPMIQITFDTAEGLKVGESQVKYRDIQMGTVEAFDLTPDRSKVLMHVRMTHKADELMTDGAQFWVVKPRVFAGDITGLNTVLSGSYIEMLPGTPGEPARRSFNGLANPPALQIGAAGRQFRLTAARLGPISLGTPIFFHDLEVGKVLGWDIAGMADSVTLNIFVNAPYDRWVYKDSRFWNTSGIKVSLGAGGVQLQVDSLKAAVLGGITFDTPPGGTQAPVSADGDVFTLYPDQKMAETALAVRRAVLASYFTGSVGGLDVGASVLMQGMHIGNVTAVDLQYDTDTDRSRVRAEFVLQLDHVKVVGDKPAPPFPEYLHTLVGKGLRSRLKGGNLLTGRKEIAVEFEADVPQAELTREGDALVIPSTGGGDGGIEDLSATANQLMAKIGAMPFAEIGQNLNGALQGVNGFTNSPELSQALTRLNTTLAATQDTVRRLDAGAAPALRRLPAIAAELQETLAQVRTLANSVSNGQGRVGRDLDLALIQVGEAARSIRMVADLLSRHPEALIRGRTSRADN